ncbi:MAG: acyl-CoA synthetase [SAR324 cluster bacterium]|nr:acyl-CoA synthetase [SAR324 cluster bacterium]
MSHELTKIPLVHQATVHGEKTAVVDTDGQHSYQQLLHRANIVATHLLQGKDDLCESRVAFIVPSGFNYVAIQWGIWMAGGVAVPLCVTHPKPEMEYVIENAESRILVAHPEFEPSLKPLAAEKNLQYFSLSDILIGEPGALPEVTIDRRAMILYTSGTTSKPKGVVTTHKIITSQITCLIKAWEWSSDDYIVHVLPLHHVHGIINVLCCALWAGAACEMPERFDPESVWNSFIENKSTVFMAVPTIYARLIKYWESSSLSQQQEMSRGCRGLRLMVSGSAALPVAMFKQWKKISGHDFLERYGMTEIGMAISNPYRGERRPGYVGKPLPGVTIRLVDDAGNEVREENVPGEIQMKSDSVFLEYWKNPEATRNTFSGDWFCTGDIAVLTKGYYRILGRSSVDIIKSGGYKVSALEIEEILRTHPLIQECAVVGIESDEWGELVAAAIQMENHQQLTLRELRDWGKERLAPYKVPQMIKQVEALPRNVMGKVTKAQVKKLFQLGTLNSVFLVPLLFSSIILLSPYVF